MSADAALRAAQAIHDTCPSTDCYDLSQDAANCEACTEQARAAVDAARPIIERQVLRDDPLHQALIGLFEAVWEDEGIEEASCAVERIYAARRATERTELES